MLVCIPELILVRETQTHLGSAERKEFVSSQNPEAGSERDTSQFLKCWEDSLSICSALLCISSTFLHYRLTSSLTKSLMASIFKASKGKGGEFEQSQDRYSRGHLEPGASPRLYPWKWAAVAPSTRSDGGTVQLLSRVQLFATP